MTRSRLAVVALALPLLLAACGGGGSDAKAEIIEQLRQEAADSGAPPEMVDCVVSAMESLSEEELTAVAEDTASPETEEAVMNAMMECGALEE
jgi:hypothetical protein